MKRNLAYLSDRTFDLIVVGGGIYGSCVALDATQRGLSVALVEKADYGSATSANSLKIIHGGFRYLQQADIRRMRESIAERRTLMQIAPHLIHPIPVMIPIYGHGKKGREAFFLALILNSMIAFDRNRINDPQKHSPIGRVASVDEVLNILPDIKQQGLTGGVIFYDSQVYNSERLTLAFIRSAEKAGAIVANYVEVTGFLKTNDCISGVTVKDILTGESFDIQAKTVVNTSGPWFNNILNILGDQRPARMVKLAKAINLVTRPVFNKYAVGISAGRRVGCQNISLNKSGRYLFFVPWRDRTMIGTSYESYIGDPEDFRITGDDIQNLLDEINSAYPAAALKKDDVFFVHGGLLPSTGISEESGEPRLISRHEINDHSSEGIRGLISVLGVKYTTARHVAEMVVDRVFELCDRESAESQSSSIPLHGGQIERFEDFLVAEMNKGIAGLSEKEVRRLVYNYGSEYTEVLKYMDSQRDSDKQASNWIPLLKAETVYAVREEMAITLSDVVFRRTELGTAGNPGGEAIKICADVMGEELGWNRAKIENEIQEVNGVFEAVQRR